MLIEKIKTIKTIKTAMDINIIEARLLTKEEAEKLPQRLRLYNNWWWTSTAYAYSSDFTWIVRGQYVYFSYGRVVFESAVRPALIFESNDFKVGDRFFFGEKEFEVIKEGLAFCTTDIGGCSFRDDWEAKDANQYEASDIKKYIDKWFKENIK